MELWCPLALRADRCEYTPKEGSNGEGILLGMRVGAARSRCYPAPMVHPVNLEIFAPGFDSSWLYVDRDGKRFCCEVAYEPIVTNARMNAPGNITWAIFDGDCISHYHRMEPNKAQFALKNAESRIEAAVEKGRFLRANSLEELASIIHVPADNLLRTVDRYNHMCETGVDKDFGAPARFLSSVKNPPFYACKIAAWLLDVPYGLHVNNRSAVCDENDDPIDGLYAVGNVQGDFFANSSPVTMPGISHGRALTFGHLVGRALALGYEEELCDLAL